MTAPTLPRPTVEESSTPESQNLDSLLAMLADPTLAGFHDDIRESIRRLTATSVLGA